MTMTKSRALRTPAARFADAVAEPPAAAPTSGAGGVRTTFGLAHASAIEFVASVSLGFVFACLGVATAMGFLDMLRRMDFAHPSLASVAEVLSRLAIASFMMLVSWLVLIRLRPVAKSSGLAPRIAALIGTFLQLARVLLPRQADTSITVKLISSALILGGNSLALYVLTWLGRSFSIMPEARRLVTGGPYGIVRHPLYLAEFIASMGVLLQFFSPYAALISGTQAGFQILRMHFEERVLRSAFPDYAAYSRRTWRVIPGLY